MANLNSAAQTELQKLRGEVEQLTKAKAMLKGALQESEDAKKTLRESYEKKLVEGKQREGRQQATMTDMESELERVLGSKTALEDEIAALQKQLADANAHRKEMESKLSDTQQLLDKEALQLADEKEKGAVAAAAAKTGADKLQAELAAMGKAKAGLEEELSDLRQSLEGESHARGKVAEERTRLQQEVAESQEQYRQLLATVEQWASWRGTLSQQVLQVKEAQR